MTRYPYNISKHHPLKKNLKNREYPKNKHTNIIATRRVS